MNNPYPKTESKENTYYISYSEKPKFLDPAIAYYSYELSFLSHIYEPVVQYHYLKRPYKIIPLTTVEVPTCEYFDKNGRKLPENAPEKNVYRAIWTIRLRKGIKYQNHPCFAKSANGKYLYRNLKNTDMKGIKTLFDFKKEGTRELKAADYVYQIKRLADSRVGCPIYSSVVEKYILGMNDFHKAVSQNIKEQRKARKKAAEKRGDLFFNREDDEKEKPIIVDYNTLNCPGVKILDQYTFQIILTKKYPQFLYWLAMPFFAPMPKEAIDFYGQGALAKLNISLKRYPVGTGPYRISFYEPNSRIILEANQNYHEDLYPNEGEPEDKEKGLLKDAGKQLPLMKKIIFTKDPEPTPRWNKFLQGYYDDSGISSDNFSNVMDFSQGQGQLSEKMLKKGIRLTKNVQPMIRYMAFNMRNKIIGGLSEKQCKLRRAISLAVDYESFIQIFLNGRAIPAYGPIPPGLAGYFKGKDGINSFLYDWDEKQNRAIRKDLNFAKQLMKEAGYPNGISNKTGKSLTLFYDTVKSQGMSAVNSWLKKKYALLGINLVIRETDLNRFREKLDTGNFQVYSSGWYADYPDPENFVFLLYGAYSKMDTKGVNGANYKNPEYDKLFEQMATMENSPERMRIIKKMLKIVQHDAPWHFGYHSEAYNLYHQWMSNIKSTRIVNNKFKYWNLDNKSRKTFREENNQPKIFEFLMILVGILSFIIPGVYFVLREDR